MAGLGLQGRDGAFPGGRNGPHRDVETPVRATSHWIQTLLKAHETTRQPALRDAAARAAAYLTGSAVRPHGATFWCRTNAGKSSCNGLIGQAWVIEALDAAADSLEESRYRGLAGEIFELHPFEPAEGLWRIVDIDGRPGPIDRTFNHQVWFAAAAALLDATPTGTIGRQVHGFLDAVTKRHLRVAPSGRIVHRMAGPAASPPGESSGRRRVAGVLNPRFGARRVAQSLFWTARRWADRPRQIRLAVGYHAFNLHGLALIRQRVPAHPLWTTPRFRAALRFVNDDAYVRALERNVYGYPYNPVGFEVAFALQAFGAPDASDHRSDAWWVARQLSRTYDWTTGLLTRGTDDPVTLAARLYEACRLRDIPLPAANGEEVAGRIGGAGPA